MHRRPLLAALALLAGSLFVAPAAAGTCEVLGTTLTVAGQDDLVIARAGDNITVDGEQCEGATVTSIDTIIAEDNSADGGINVHIDLSNGALAPGATEENDGLPEIEISLAIAPRGDDYDALVVTGGAIPDHFTLGRQGVGLNSDEDADVTATSGFPNLNMSLSSGDGTDTISAQGGLGTGEPWDTDLYLAGGAGEDVLTGGTGPDQLTGGPGADTLDGGDGDAPAPYVPYDALTYDGATTAVTVDLAANTASGGDAAGDTYVSIDSVFGGEGADTLSGDAGINALIGAGGADTLNGRAGDDYLEGQAGADKLNGDDGADSINYFGSPEPIQVDLFSKQIAGGHGQGDTFTNVEDVSGSPGDDTIRGDKADNELGGYDGNDVIEGREGNDFIAGDNGADREVGGDGDDYFSQRGSKDAGDKIIGGGGNDVADYWGRTNPVSLSSDGVANDGERNEKDNLKAIEQLGASDNDDTLRGSDAKDDFRGRGGDDDLATEGGADRLVGGAGNDELDGGPGKDVINGGPGRDVCYVTAGDETRGCERRERRAH